MDNIEYALCEHLAPIKKWLENESVSDICLNPDGRLWIDANHQFTVEDSHQLFEPWLNTLVSLCARYNETIANSDAPLLQGRLPNGSRIQLCLPPITDRISFVIRRHHAINLSLDDYKDDHDFIDLQSKKRSLDNQNEAFSLSRLRELVIAQKSIIIAGGTGSGKTTFLRALLAEIPKHERLVLLEDTPELSIPHENKLPLTARGNSKFDMQLLLKTALRCRPDRIIMGEIRSREMFDFVSSLNSGHSGGMATIHAGSVTETWQRMVHLYKQNNVPAMTSQDILTEIQAVIDCVVVLKRTHSGRKLVDVYEK